MYCIPSTIHHSTPEPNHNHQYLSDPCTFSPNSSSAAVWACVTPKTDTLKRSQGRSSPPIRTSVPRGSLVCPAESTVAQVVPADNSARIASWIWLVRLQISTSVWACESNAIKSTETLNAMTTWGRKIIPPAPHFHFISHQSKESTPKQCISWHHLPCQG